MNNQSIHPVPHLTKLTGYEKSKTLGSCVLVTGEVSNYIYDSNQNLIGYELYRKLDESIHHVLIADGIIIE